MGMLDRFRRTTPEPLGEPLAAAAVRVLQPSKLSNNMVQSRATGEAWEVYRRLGEVGYATNQQARLVGRLDWTLTLGEGEPLKAEQSNQMLRAAYGDNLDALTEKMALCLQVPGGYVFARTIPGDRDSWRVFSSPLSAKNKKRVEGADIAIQIRIEDPEDEDLNDSPTLRALDTCRDLILARAESRANSRNRTAQHGLLLYPVEGVKDTAEFESGLQEVITAPLSDERTTASVTPNLVGFPAEHIEKIRMLDIGGKYDEKLDAKDDRLVRSISVQLDIPPELLMGFADSNHWAAWATQEDNWTGHVAPMAKPVGACLAAGIREIAGATEVKIEPDPGPLMVRRPTTADALAAFEAGLVSEDWTREQLGADESDAPTPEELARRTPADPEPIPAAPAVAEPAAIAAALQGRLPVAAAAKGPDPRALQAIDVQAYDAVEDLVNDTADRVLDRLGAKVRTMARSLDLPADVSNARLAVEFSTNIPNAEVAINDTIAQAIPRLDRVVDRAFARLRSAGVETEQDPDDATSARSLFSVLVADVVATRLASKPTAAAAWQAARRVIGVAGGNGDIAPEMAS